MWWSFRFLVFIYALTSCLFSHCFFNDPATTEIYTLSLHDALPILEAIWTPDGQRVVFTATVNGDTGAYAPTSAQDRKSTRLNSSHRCISYAVFCLKKKKKKQKQTTH